MSKQHKKMIYTENTSLGFANLGLIKLLESLKHQKDIISFNIQLDDSNIDLSANSADSMLKKLEDKDLEQTLMLPELEYSLTYELNTEQNTKIYIDKTIGSQTQPALRYSIENDSRENLDELNKTILYLYNYYTNPDNNPNLAPRLEYTGNNSRDMEEQAAISMNETYNQYQNQLNNLNPEFTIYGFNTRAELRLSPDSPDNPYNNKLQVNMSSVLDEGNLSGDKPSMGVISMSGDPKNRFSIDIKDKNTDNLLDNAVPDESKNTKSKLPNPFNTKPNNPIEL